MVTQAASSKATKAAGKPKTLPKTVTKSTSGRPSWKEIIKECILHHRDEARSGVSRSTIKKYAEDKYKLAMDGLQTSQLNRAISSGAEAGVFMLPKGPSGKVKLAPKEKPNPAKENTKPASRKKLAVKENAVSPTRKPVAKPKALPTSKKTAPKAKSVAKKISSAKATKKQPAAKAAAAAKAKASPSTSRSRRTKVPAV